MISHFHTSSRLLQRPNHSLYASIDWVKVDAGCYAVVDPIDSHAILYLSERAYQIQVRVSLSQDSPLIVLARPGDRPEVADPNKSKEDASTKNSPIPDVSKNSKVWKKFLSWHLSSLRGALVGRKEDPKNSKKGSSLKRDSKGDASVTVSAEVIRLLFPYWGLDLHYRLGRGVTPPRALVQALREMADKMVELHRNHGVQELIMKMKNSLFMLNRYLADPSKPANPWLLGTPVGLARNRIPKLIPLLIRRGIANGDVLYMRLMISILNGYKALEGTHKEQDLESVLGPHPELDPKIEEEFRIFCKEVFWPKVIKGYASKAQWKKITECNFRISDTDSVYIPLRAGPNAKQGLFGAGFDALAWTLEPVNWPIEWAKAQGDTRTPKVFDSALSGITPEFIRKFFGERKGKPYQVVTGKLELLPEPAGKVRTIAIVDYWTQRLMSPVHEWMMEVLKLLPTDGTFCQEEATRSFARFVSLSDRRLYSIDLKSATDLIPIALYRHVLSGIWNEHTVDLWISLLTDRWFRVPDSKLVSQELRGRLVQYGRGQPMGTLSSWPSMALVHHALVLFSAQRAGYDPTHFVDYRVLGDDNCTCGDEAAMSYVETASALCVPTSTAKTLDGCLFIFASQIFWKGINISPLSLKEELGIASYAQRLEQALRAVRRGWIDDRNTLPRFLRLLLTQRDYRASLRQWSVGRLGKIAQSALVSAFGLASRSLLDLLGFQGSGFKPFLLSLENKVEALAGDHARLSGKVSELAFRDLERAFAAATARVIYLELQQELDRLEVASQRFGEWDREMKESGFMPLYTRVPVRRNSEGRVVPRETPGILFVPSSTMPKEVFLKALAMTGEMRKHITMPKRRHPEEFIDSNGKVCRSHPRAPLGAQIAPWSAEECYNYTFSETNRVHHRSLWPVIYDSYRALFGDTTGEEPEYSDFEAEEDGYGGMGMTCEPEGYTSSAQSGAIIRTPGVITKVKTARDKARSIMEQIKSAPIEELGSPWFLLMELCDVLARIQRVPSFTSIRDWEPLKPRDPDLLRPWVRSARLITQVLRHLPFGTDLSVPLETELPAGPLNPAEAGATLALLAEQPSKTNQGLLTG